MNRYPTDEELDRLIEALEGKPLYAPSHLQENVLCKLKEEGEKRERTERTSFFLYSVKMAVGMAAAIVLLFAIPANDGSDRSYASQLHRESRAAGEKLDMHFENGREKLSQLSEKINAITDELFQKEDLGGYYHES